MKRTIIKSETRGNPGELFMLRYADAKIFSKDCIQFKHGCGLEARLPPGVVNVFPNAW